MDHIALYDICMGKYVVVVESSTGIYIYNLYFQDKAPEVDTHH